MKIRVKFIEVFLEIFKVWLRTKISKHVNNKQQPKYVINWYKLSATQNKI